MLPHARVVGHSMSVLPTFKCLLLSPFVSFKKPSRATIGLSKTPNCIILTQILIEKWRIHYNTVRPHISLGYKSACTRKHRSDGPKDNNTLTFKPDHPMGARRCMISRSAQSSLISVPNHFPNKVRSPALTSIMIRAPSLLIFPVPTETTAPC